MSRTVYAIASGKGGVGKTTTAVNLGAALAADDASVVVVDTDLGMANLAGFLDFEVDRATLHEVLAGEADLEDAIYAAPGGVDVGEETPSGRRTGSFDVVPSSTDIETFARADTARLGDIVADLREEYDYVLLDTGAGISHDTVLPLGLADEVLLVSTPDVASVSDAAKTGDLTERVGGTLAGAVLNKRASNILDAKDVEERLGTDVLAVVPSDEAVPTSIDAGRPAVDFAPTSPAALVYEGLAAVLTVEDPDTVRAGDFEPADTEQGADTKTAADAEADLADGTDAEEPDVGEADAVPFGDGFKAELDAEAAADAPVDDPLVDSTVAEPAADAPADFRDADAADLLGLDSDAERELRNVIEGAEESAVVAGDDDPDAVGADAGDDTPDAGTETVEAAVEAEESDGSANPAEPTAEDYIEPAEGARSAPDEAGETAEAEGEPEDDAAEDALSSLLDEEDGDASESKSEGKDGFFGRLSGMFSR